MECAAGQALPAPGKPPHKSKRPCAACCKRRGRGFAFCKKVEIRRKCSPVPGCGMGLCVCAGPCVPPGSGGL